jgi:hypothetical protein
MADNTEQQVNATQNEESKESTDEKPPVPNIDEIITNKVNENLKPIKENLDKAYKARDEALKKVAEYEQREKEAELKRLQEAGKFKEAFEMQLAEERARRETLEKRNIELTRDINVRNSLSAIEFKNDTARNVAYREIVEQLVQNDQGEWVHRSGLSINDYIKSYVESEEYSFLLKPKISSGAGGSSPSQSSSVSSGKSKSLFDLTQEEVLKLAAEGRLPQRK